LLRELFHIGPVAVRSYGLMMDIGIIAALFLSWYLAKKKGKDGQVIMNMAFYLIIAGLIGARLWEVIFSWDYYSNRPGEIFAIWQGGLSVQGAIIGGMIAAVVYTKRQKISFWEYADIMAPGVILAQGIGRVGCFLNGCCYGLPASSGWGVVYPEGTDAFTVFGATPLIPVVLYEAAWDLVVMTILLFLLFRKPFNGFIATLYFALYAAGRFVLEFYRADSLLIMGGLKAAQVTSVITLIVALGVMIYLGKTGRNTNRQNTGGGR